ncbi:MAG: HlyD family efflux transporter periplasmic adaptor subunit [Caulobacteraceae bacterium]|nr:HlyD family efflux transporter periplasmic adaptor subunit [Caulobacteraceae bacterium]
MTLRIIHEASTQRQHVRVRAPLMVRIGRDEYTAFDWSVAGIGVRGLDPLPSVGQIIQMALLFRFDGFSFEINVSGEVRHVNARTGDAGLVLIELEPEQLALLQYVVGAYMSGEIVSSGDILAITKRENFTGARALKAAETGSNKAIVTRNLVALALLWVAGVALVGLLAFNLYSRLFIVRADGFLAGGEAIAATAPAAGLASINASAGARVQPGTVLGTIQTPTGEVASLTAGCDCLVGSVVVDDGAFVAAGAKLVELVPASATLEGEFLVPLNKAARIKAGDVAMVEFYGSRQPQRARVERVVLPKMSQAFANGGREAAFNSVVRVKFTDAPPLSLLGQPATVRINAPHF